MCLNDYPEQLVDSTIRNFGRKGQPDTQTVTIGMVVIPYVKDVSENFMQMGKKYNIMTIFKTKHTLCNTLIRTKPNIRTQ